MLACEDHSQVLCGGQEKNFLLIKIILYHSWCLACYQNLGQEPSRYLGWHPTARARILAFDAAVCLLNLVAQGDIFSTIWQWPRRGRNSFECSVPSSIRSAGTFGYFSLKFRLSIKRATSPPLDDLWFHSYFKPSRAVSSVADGVANRYRQGGDIRYSSAWCDQVDLLPDHIILNLVLFSWVFIILFIDLVNQGELC